MIKQPGEELGNHDICINEDGTISFKAWVKSGGMMCNRDCLPATDELHIYNVVVSHGLNPDDYGLEHPLVAEFKDWSRSRLINEIVKLRDSLDCAARYGML